MSHATSKYDAAWRRFKDRYGCTHNPMLLGALDGSEKVRLDAWLKEAYAHAWNAALTDERQLNSGGDR